MASDDEGLELNDGLTRRQLLQRGAVAGVALTTGGLGAQLARAATPTAAPKKGGTLRVGLNGLAASADQLSPFVQFRSGFDQARAQNLYSRIFAQQPDGSFKPNLAESAEPNKTADVWIVKLKSGIVWHDGSPFTADDVIYTFGAVLSRNPAYAAMLVNFPMIKRVAKVNSLTVKFILNRPWADFPLQLGQNVTPIMKKGTKTFDQNTPGTGPFKLESWTPGQGYVMARNPNYFEGSKPYVDKVQVTGVSDPTARLNGLLAGQFDAIERVDPTQNSIITSNPSAKLLAGPPGAYTPVTMNLKAAPFDNVNVRTALKLLVDRENMVKVALQGFGAVGNDVFGFQDGLYSRKLPQRTYDPEKARSLLRTVGMDGLSVTLDSTTLQPVELSSALLFAQSAKAAGVNISVVNHPAATYTAQVTPVSPFHQATPSWRPFISAWLGFMSSTGQNLLETRWSNRKSNRLIDQIEATIDEKKRNQLAHEVQMMLWDRGGYIIWGFQQQVDGLGKSVMGFEGSRSLPLGFYGFKDAWLG